MSQKEITKIQKEFTKTPEKSTLTRHGSYLTTRDGTEIYYKDWGEGPAVTFSHGWPLNSDAWDGQMLFLVQHGFRAIAHHRRGHGRSSQASNGNDMNGYADDLAAVIEALDLHDASREGSPDLCGSANYGEDRYQSRRPAHSDF